MRTHMHFYDSICTGMHVALDPIMRCMADPWHGMHACGTHRLGTDTHQHDELLLGRASEDLRPRLGLEGQRGVVADKRNVQVARAVVELRHKGAVRHDVQALDPGQRR